YKVTGVQTCALPISAATRLAQIALEAKARGMVANPEAIRFEQDFVRTYPNGPLLCHVLGFTNGENMGMDGVERSMEQYLRGNDGDRKSVVEGKRGEL